jgi:hypothetical protein
MICIADAERIFYWDWRGNLQNANEVFLRHCKLQGRIWLVGNVWDQIPRIEAEVIANDIGIGLANIFYRARRIF